MLNRRHILQAAAGLATLPVLATAARADWKADYPEIVFATIPDENATGVEKRYEPFIQYLGKMLGVPVKLRIANDYAAVIEGQIAENIHIALYGPSSFARALMNGAKIDAFAMQVNKDGSKAYYSVMYVKADAPYTSIQDLKGKNLGLVDPNSTSGNAVPRFAMNNIGIKPEEFFANVVYTGSHENAIIALQQGQVDAVFNSWTDENESNLRRMERKGMAKYDDFKIVFKSDPIVNSPFAMLSSLPAELQAGIKDAFFSIDKNDPEAFQVMTDGQQQLWVPTDNAAYQGIIELNKFVDTLRKA